MKKNIYLIITIFGIITLLIGIAHCVQDIQARGFNGVNYGQVLFPLIISIGGFYLYKKYK